MKLQTNRIPGLVLTDHVFEVPLDYSKPEGEKIEVFGREVVSPANEKKKLPWLVYLQGKGRGKCMVKGTQKNKNKTLIKSAQKSCTNRSFQQMTT